MLAKNIIAFQVKRSQNIINLHSSQIVVVWVYYSLIIFEQPTNLKNFFSLHKTADRPDFSFAIFCRSLHAQLTLAKSLNVECVLCAFEDGLYSPVWCKSDGESILWLWYVDMTTYVGNDCYCEKTINGNANVMANYCYQKFIFQTELTCNRSTISSSGWI